METFSLLKYWRNGAAGAATGSNTDNPRASTKTIITSPAAVSPYSSDSEDGAYFDLEFSHPDEKEKTQKEENETKSDVEEEEEGIKLCVENENVIISPSNELILKGDLISIEPSSILLNGSQEIPKFPVSLLKSATKFRVLLLKLKKSKSGNGFFEKTAEHEINSTQKVPISRIQAKQGNFTVKVEEAKVPVICKDCKGLENDSEDSDSNTTSDEKKLTKKVVQKYLEIVKPLYVRVEKLKFSGHSSFLHGDSPPCTVAEKGGEVSASCMKTNLKQGNNNLQAGFKVVRKHLGKSRSASATVAAPPQGKMGSDRRDDSLLQLHDGIQGAILHCKKSFNASRDVESSSLLFRSASDPSYEKSAMMPMISSASSSSSYSGEAKEIEA